MQILTHTKVINEAFWKVADTLLVKIVQIIVTIVIARLIGPKEYGLVTMTLVFVNFMNIFVLNSFGAALVHNQKANIIDYYTSLIFNLVFSIVLYLILVLCSGSIAVFYKLPSLKVVLIVLGILIPLRAVISICNSYITKHLLYRKYFICNSVSIIIAGTVGVSLAIFGFGVWALVSYQIVYYVILSFMIWFVFSWPLMFKFSNESLRGMIRYGSASIGAGFISFVSDNVATMLIGKASTTEVSLYSRGKQFPTIFTESVNTVIAGVTFPVLAQYQNDLPTMRRQVSYFLRSFSYISCPLLVGLFVCAKPLITLLLGEAWVGAIPIMQLMCLYYLFQPFLQINGQILLAYGMPSIKMVGELIKMILTIFALFLSVKHGIIYITLSQVFVNILLCIYSMIITKRYLSLSMISQIKDYVIPTFPAITMGLIIWLFTFLNINDLILILLQTLFGVIVFVLISKFSNNSTYYALEFKIYQILINIFRCDKKL